MIHVRDTKYACISGCIPNEEGDMVHISHAQLIELYKVKSNECWFYEDILDYTIQKILRSRMHLIPLTPRPNGDYETHLKILKAHHLVENKL